MYISITWFSYFLDHWFALPGKIDYLVADVKTTTEREVGRVSVLDGALRSQTGNIRLCHDFWYKRIGIIGKYCCTSAGYTQDPSEILVDEFEKKHFADPLLQYPSLRKHDPSECSVCQDVWRKRTDEWTRVQQPGYPYFMDAAYSTRRRS